MKISTSLLLSLILIFIFGCDTEKVREKIPGLITDSAMVVTAHPIATEVGIQLLRDGGNAVDAAIAVQFALAVVYPYAGNIGGGGFMLYRGNEGEVAALDFREKAPLSASRDMYLDSTGNIIPDLSWQGHLSAGVPGTVDGMAKAHAQFGSLPWKTLLMPAILLAKNGFVITERQAKIFDTHHNNFAKYNSEPEHIPYFKNDFWKGGDTIRQIVLAATLERIAKEGSAGFYSGETAERIVEEMEKGGGIISLEDLQSYEAQWRNPVVGKYKSYTLISMPPPSSGGIAILQMLGMIEDHDIGKMGWNSPEGIHLMAEAGRRVFADRASFLGDSDFSEIPISELIGKNYLQERMKNYSAEIAGVSAEIEAGNPYDNEGTETTHFSIVDAMGNAVSITTTVNDSFGSKVFIPGGGFLLNDEMDDFSAKPGVPNAYGLLGNERNAIQPEKRMLSSMTPTLVEKDGKLWMVLGSPGGSKIITSVFQSFLNVAEHEMSMQEAVDAARVHHQWFPDQIYYEGNNLAADAQRKLENMGHHLKSIGSMGAVNAILVLPDGMLEAGADKRRECVADGY